MLFNIKYSKNKKNVAYLFDIFSLLRCIEYNRELSKSVSILFQSCSECHSILEDGGRSITRQNMISCVKINRKYRTNFFIQKIIVFKKIKFESYVEYVEYEYLTKKSIS